MNALIFMYKKRHFSFALPHSVRETIANNAPIPGSNHDTNLEWLTNYNDPIYRNSLLFKGPLLSIISELSEWRACNFPLNHIHGFRKAPPRQAPPRQAPPRQAPPRQAPPRQANNIAIYIILHVQSTRSRL